MNSGFDTFMGQFVVQRRPASCRTPSQYELSKVGFPIRKSSDQSLFAAPQGLSQRTTSFIASQRQGIHRMPLRHLITLMIDVRRLSRDRLDTERPFAPELFSSRACLPNTSDTGLWKPCWSLGDVSLPTLGYVPSSRFQNNAPSGARSMVDQHTLP